MAKLREIRYIKGKEKWKKTRTMGIERFIVQYGLIFGVSCAIIISILATIRVIFHYPHFSPINYFLNRLIHNLVFYIIFGLILGYFMWRSCEKRYFNNNNQNNKGITDSSSKI
jgi:hypothetical protein